MTNPERPPLNAYASFAQEAGAAIRQLSALRRWAEVQKFYRALLRRGSSPTVARLTNLTLSVWDRPERFR